MQRCVAPGALAVACGAGCAGRNMQPVPPRCHRERGSRVSRAPAAVLSRGSRGARQRPLAPRRAAPSDAAIDAALAPSAPDGLAAALAAAKAAAAAAQQAADAARNAMIAADDAADRAAAVFSQLEAQRRSGAFAPRDSDPAPPVEAQVDTQRRLPRYIFILRHGESQGNVDETMYCRVPDPEIALTRKGHAQAAEAGQAIRDICDADGAPYKLFFYISPYKRTKQTAAGVASAFRGDQVMGVREEPQLREQDFGNFQDSATLVRKKTERESYGRFFYRFPNGESGADVYDRLTVFEDHLVRDIDLGRFPAGTHIVLVTHGLALRIFLARWFHWTVAETESAWNPPNCAPLVMERVAAGDGDEGTCALDGSACNPGGNAHTKDLYRLTPESLALLQAEDEGMCRMMQPERAWGRTLGDAGAEWQDEDDTQCPLPVEYAAEE